MSSVNRVSSTSAMNVKGAVGRQRKWLVTLAGLAAACATVVALVAWLNVRGESSDADTPVARSDDGLIQRGAYLARAGNCIGCHQGLDGRELAGGQGVETPFGVVRVPNISADVATGIGAWSAGDFWRALHHGRSRDGRLLYPAFPYPSYTQVSRQDSDALFAFLQSTAPVARGNAAHELRFPFNTQAALAVWRALFFSPGEFEPEAGQGAEWNRGKYLVQGLGHCVACHASRNFMGGSGVNAAFAGGLMPDESWYAPSLADPQQAGVQRWSRDEIVRLLKSGVANHGSVAGPMAAVVSSSTRHLDDGDLDAMARYLATIPEKTAPATQVARAAPETLQLGGKVYSTHCATCHGAQGQGVPGIYPPLAGNRAVTLPVLNNLVQTLRRGGFAPSTRDNPMPFGMPPFGQLLTDTEMAAVATYVRQSWGNAAGEVTALDVLKVR